MSKGFVFIDVETPNRHNNRICSIGVSRSDHNGQVEYERHILINPEQGFDSRNTDIHGITPSGVRECPTFTDIWTSELESVFSGCTVVAHNASFDLNVLGKTLTYYGHHAPDLLHVCTLSASKRLLTNLPSFTLPSVSEYFGISLPQHHNALYDAQVCRQIYWRLLDQYGSSALVPRQFVYSHSLNTPARASNLSRLMTDLYGIVLGASLDSYVSPAEHIALTEWADEARTHENDPIIHTALGLLDDVLADNMVDASEQEQLISLSSPFVTDGHNCPETVCLQQLLGIIKGISADRVINECESENLRAWMNENSDMSENPTFALVKEEIDAVLADGKIEPDEEDRLLKLFERIIYPMEESTSEIIFTDRRFVLSGDFSFGSKSEVEAVIRERGGEVAKSVSSKVHYVVVGSRGSEAYAHGNYGTKVKKAMELQDKGKPIQVITESHLQFS